MIKLIGKNLLIRFFAALSGIALPMLLAVYSSPNVVDLWVYSQRYGAILASFLIFGGDILIQRRKKPLLIRHKNYLIYAMIVLSLSILVISYTDVRIVPWMVLFAVVFVIFRFDVAVRSIAGDFYKSYLYFEIWPVLLTSLIVIFTNDYKLIFGSYIIFRLLFIHRWRHIRWIFSDDLTGLIKTGKFTIFFQLVNFIVLSIFLKKIEHAEIEGFGLVLKLSIFTQLLGQLYYLFSVKYPNLQKFRVILIAILIAILAAFLLGSIIWLNRDLLVDWLNLEAAESWKFTLIVGAIIYGVIGPLNSLILLDTGRRLKLNVLFSYWFLVLLTTTMVTLEYYLLVLTLFQVMFLMYVKSGSITDGLLRG